MSDEGSQQDHHEEGVSTDNDKVGEEQEYGEEGEPEEDPYMNNHDLIGVQGIIRAQKNEIEKKKVSWLITDSVAWSENRKWEVLQKSPRASSHAPEFCVEVHWW